MSGEKKSLSYFAAMAGCFRGTAAFDILIFHSMWRAVWHAVLTVVLLGLVTATVQVVRFSGSIQESAAHFEAVFGSIRVDMDRGVISAKTPTESHYLLLNQGGVLVYTPGAKEVVLPEKSTFRDYRYAICWYPAGLVFVMPVAEEGKYAVNAVKFGENFGTQKLCSTGELQTLLASVRDTVWQRKEALSRSYDLGASEIVMLIKWVTWIGFLGIFCFDAGAQILMCLLIFVGFFALTSGRSRTLKWGELVRIALYAGCPALAVAACFTALDLTDILGFGTVYVIGTIGYFLVIVNKIEQARHHG